MSELINTHDNRATIHWKLLTGVSALTLMVYVSSTNVANADDASRPPIWIELDGQFAQQKNDQDVFLPSFLPVSPFPAASQIGIEKAPPTIWNKGAEITFQPGGSDWVLSLGIRYGKSARDEGINLLTAHAGIGYGDPYDAFQIVKAPSSENHTIVDFQVGKDVGLGRFVSSVVGAGVRIAQFNSRSHVDIKSQPTNCNAYCPYNKFYASFDASRRFTGIGPSLSWHASTNIAGNPSDGGISLDWGVNGAVLFGRQRMAAQEQTSENHFNYFHRVPVYHTSTSVARSKNVTVPNLSGFAAVSWRYAAAKVTLGYRADYFFGVLDGGIDTAKKEDRAFYGPYASISIGIGD